MIPARFGAACAIFFILFIIPLAHAQSYEIKKMEITFDIRADNSISQANKFYFSAPFNGSSLLYNLTDRATNIQVLDDKGSLIYRTIGTPGAYAINISFVEPTSTLTLSYVAGNAIFRSDTVDIFYTEFSFEKSIANMSAKVYLPEGYSIYQGSYSPLDAVLGSDGRRITLLWNEQNVNNIMVFSVKFIAPQQDGGILFGVIIALLGGIILFYLFYRERSKEHFMTGFRADEQKVIEFLEAKKVALQSDLQKEFHFSRSKATRIVHVLEEKKVLRKQKYGRTNRLFWLR